MRVIKIQIQPFEILSILKYEEIQQMNEHLELAAANKITLTQGGSQLELSDGIRLSGAVIKMQ